MKNFALVFLLVLALASTSILGCDNNDREAELEEQLDTLASQVDETHSLLLAALGIEEINPDSIAVTIPGSVIDDEGRTVTIDAIPERILSLAPNCTEILYALGLGDKVVGRTDYCDYPEEVKDKPSVGSAWPGWDVEAIVALEPDLVLSVSGSIVDQLENLGLTVIVTKAENISDILGNIALIGGVTGTAEEAVNLIEELEERLIAVVTKTALATEKPFVFYEVDASSDVDKPWTTGADTFQDDLIRLAGGRNIASGRSGWYQIGVEEILIADPELIILEDYEYGITPESVAARSNWTGITAVTEGKVYPITEPNLTSRQGPRIIEGLEEIAEIIHPELFE